MVYDYSDILAQAQNWAETALSEGRLSAERARELLAMDLRSPAQLFGGAGHEGVRPLIVAFMGGTGVGKSSLLNRLAGQAIARVGVERPTSREVTLYHYRALSPQQLPAGLPLDSIKINQHDDAGNSNIVWIDMPDFDSVELANKRLVLEWLPHIDVLLYVVSPERYRDNKAWQLLLAEGAKHAWLFVMNQWDRGQSVQFDDFRRQLHKAGFTDPLIFRTSCAEPEGDEFAELLHQLHELSGRHNMAELVLRGGQLRKQQLMQVLGQLLNDFPDQAHAQCQQDLETLWRQAESQLFEGLSWPLQQLSQAWADNLGQKTEIQLWDDWAQNRLNDLLDQLILQAAQSGLPSKPLKTALHGVREHAGENLTARVELAGRQALVKPGNAMQRFLIRFTAVCETLLPLVAMGVVGYQVFNGYYHSAADETAPAYLGANFAIHSVLLIGLSWLIPYFLHQKIQPSLRKAAYKGARKGFRQGLATVLAQIQQALDTERKRNDVLRRQLLAIIEHCSTETPATIDKHGVLGRALLGD